MVRFILFRFMLHAILSGVVAIVIGPILGGLAGTIRKPMKKSIYISTLAAFLGCLIASAMPPISHVGSFESWGSGGFGGLQAMVMFILMGVGGLFGSLLANLFLFKFFLGIKPKVLIAILVGVYTLMAILLYHGYSRYCAPPPGIVYPVFSYC